MKKKAVNKIEFWGIDKNAPINLKKVRNLKVFVETPVGITGGHKALNDLIEKINQKIINDILTIAEDKRRGYKKEFLRNGLLEGDAERVISLLSDQVVNLRAKLQENFKTALLLSPFPELKDAPNYFVQTGDSWVIRFAGKDPIPLQNSRGLSIIAFLLDKPLKDYHVNDLTRRFLMLDKSEPETSGEEEEETTDRKFYEDGLIIPQDVVPKRGKQKIEYSEVENRADQNRKNILNHLTRAYANIEKYLPDLVYFLKAHRHIKTGFTLTYHPPSPEIPWKIITKEKIS